MLDQLYSNKEIILKKSQKFFQNSTSLIPKIGCELEFFLLPKEVREIEKFIAELGAELQKNFQLIYKVEKEQGATQIEIKTIFTPALSRLCAELDSVKNFIKNFAAKKNLTASFASQPFPDDCGNALQFNISLHDESDKNIFEFDEKILKNSASALLQMTDAMMIFLAPKAEDYARFSDELNRDLFKKGKFTAPVNLSFGADNRTCAIRIPAIKKDASELKYGKRLEYRIAAAGADPSLCISAILLAIFCGIKNQKLAFEQIFGQVFGNAFDEQYQLKKFCKNFVEAREIFFGEQNFIREKMTEFFIS